MSERDDSALSSFEKACLGEAIALARRSREKGGLPFGAVLAHDGRVEHQSIDWRAHRHDPTAHAEMCVIRDLCLEQGRSYLDGFTIFCSTEPCAMCTGAIRSARISKVVFSVSQEMLRRFSGGKRKLGCHDILAGSRETVEVVGPVLVADGSLVFDGYRFPDAIGAEPVVSGGNPGSSLEMRLIDWARRLRAVGQNGLLYAETVYHEERYQAVLEVAERILDAATTHGVTEFRKVSLVTEDYATPKIDVRAAVRQGGKLLFVREADDARWSLPGGWVEVGETPRQSVEKEVLDEAGIRVRAKRLLGVFDRDRHASAPNSLFQVITLFFECEIVQPDAGDLHSETTDFRFFAREEIPELSLGRVPAALVEKVYDLVERADQATDFD